MKDEELQQYCGRNVELKYGDEVFVGKLVCGRQAQVAVNAPYAVESQIANATMGAPDAAWTSIAYAEAVEWVRTLSEPLSDERLED